MYPDFSGVRLFYFSISFVLLQALMSPSEVHDAPTLSTRVPPESPRSVKSGRTVAEVAAGLDVTEQTLCNWCNQEFIDTTEAGPELDRERRTRRCIAQLFRLVSLSEFIVEP